MDAPSESTGTEQLEADAAQLDPASASLESAVPIVQHVGRVVSASEGVLTVLVAGRRIAARRARSCLLEPRTSDLVIVAETGPRTSAWILAVLDRPGDDATLAFEGDITIRSAGEVSIASAKGTNLFSRGALRVAVDEAHLVARRLEASVEEGSWVGRVLTSRLEAIKTVATVVDRVATRVSERAQRVYRTTDEAEYVKVGQLDIRADESITAHSKNTVMTAENLVKLNGDQIHLG